MPSVTVKDVDAHAFVRAYAAYLKRSGKLEIPKWVDIVKTGAYKEMAPLDPDWFYHRVAAIARQVYIHKGTGVGELRRIHGGKLRRGARPNVHAKASGAVIRRALQALEKVRVLEKDPFGGRMITSIGQQELDRIAHQVVESAE